MIKINIICEKPDKVLNILSTQIQGLSYSLANKALRKKDIRINNKKISKNISVNVGETITVFLPDDYKKSIDEKKFFTIFYEDKNILIVNKNKGIEVVSPTENITIDTFLNKTKKVYPLNRLDRNTEGLVIFAKSRKMLEKLKKAMKSNQIDKFYLAEVVGVPKWDNFIATGYLIKDEEKSDVKIFDEPRKNSKKITTETSVLSRSAGGTSVFIVKIKNGKTHQIRAHLAYIGYPIIGDGKYGKNEENRKFRTKTQKLTAYKLIFKFSDSELRYLNEKEFEILPNWLKDK